MDNDQESGSQALTRHRVLAMAAVGGLIFFFCISISFTFLSIYNGVKSNCQQAQILYGGDCVEALSAVIQSDTTSFNKKNSAVWALGQLADQKALHLLRELSQNPGDTSHCTRSKEICAHEVNKALKWCAKGNSTSWMYWNRDKW